MARTKCSRTLGNAGHASTAPAANGYIYIAVIVNAGDQPTGSRDERSIARTGGTITLTHETPRENPSSPATQKKIVISDFTAKTGLIGKLKSCQLFTSVVTIDRFVKPIVYEFYAYLAPELITIKLTGGAKTRWIAKDTIKAVDLTASFALLHKIACANWMPTKHHAYVKRSMVVLLYKIDQGVMINLGKLLFQQILDARNGANGKKELILPNLIYGILVSQGFTKHDTEDYEAQSLPIKVDIRLLNGTHIDDLGAPEDSRRRNWSSYDSATVDTIKILEEESESSKKRPISHFPNLPFSDDASENLSVEVSSFPKEESPRNDDVQEKTTAPILNGDGETLRLAHSFQEQGNKLAEEDPLEGPSDCITATRFSAAHLRQDSFKRYDSCDMYDGKYREALGKWESALILMPERAVLHEQKAQILLELGDAWNALKAATRATELEPKWAEAWITLARSQLNFGEPDNAIESLDKALAIQPDSVEARSDRKTALALVKRRKLVHSSGRSMDQHRFAVGDKTESS
nr:tetratricopeptide repeat protein 33 isoform X1 [Ipomoea batatas]